MGSEGQEGQSSGLVTRECSPGPPRASLRISGIDPTIARVGFVALCLMGGAGLPLYLAAWLLIPEEGSDHSIGAHLLEHAKTAFGAT